MNSLYRINLICITLYSLFWAMVFYVATFGLGVMLFKESLIINYAIGIIITTFFISTLALFRVKNLLIKSMTAATFSIVVLFQLITRYLTNFLIIDENKIVVNEKIDFFELLNLFDGLLDKSYRDFSNHISYGGDFFPNGILEYSSELVMFMMFLISLFLILKMK